MIIKLQNRKIAEKARKEHERAFSHWAGVRDRAVSADAYMAAQEKVDEHYWAMRTPFCEFRDGENSPSILNMYGLQLPQDIEYLLDNHGYLDTKGVSHLIDLLKMAKTVSTNPDHSDPSWYRRQSHLLKALLRTAVSTNQPIYCFVEP